MRISKVSNDCIELIKKFEGCKLKAYKCPANVWTIGYGNTYYEDKSRVKEGDVITLERAKSLLEMILRDFELGVDNNTVDTITQNQFDALVDFAYNCGTGNLKSSTLLRKVNANPNDATIKDEFLKWVRANGKVMQGLVNRRKAEVELYFKK